jgi:hypothetical protein
MPMAALFPHNPATNMLRLRAGCAGSPCPGKGFGLAKRAASVGNKRTAKAYGRHSKRALGCVSRVPRQSSRIPGQRRLPAFLASASLSCSHSRAARWLATSRTPSVSRNCDRPFPGFLRRQGGTTVRCRRCCWRGGPRGTRCWLGRSPLGQDQGQIRWHEVPSCAAQQGHESNDAPRFGAQRCRYLLLRTDEPRWPLRCAQNPCRCWCDNCTAARLPTSG